jgi:predicted nuclease with TOPRIM domain
MAREGLLGQLRRIADAVEVLPEVRDHLDRLDNSVCAMTEEVVRMREGVDALGVKVDQLNGEVGVLDDQFTGMRGEIRGLDGHLGEVRKLLDPLRALAGVGKLGGRFRG